MMTTVAAASLARSYLYAPGNNERLLGKVFDAGADAVILDLEDSVPPAEKERARDMVRQRLLERAGSAPATWVRISAVGAAGWREDVRAVVEPGLAGIRVPKVDSASGLERLVEEIAAAEERSGMEPGSVRLVATIESATGLTAIPGLAGCRRLERLALGGADLLADVGADPAGREELEAWLRPQLVVGSRAAGLGAPIAPAWTRLDDEAGLGRSSEAYRRAGFFGRSLIHPRQIAVVHEVFTPTGREIERARHLLSIYEAEASAGRGAMVDEAGEFVDAAVVRRAKAVLELAASLGLDGSRRAPAREPLGESAGDSA